jgi:hypothetical protein
MKRTTAEALERIDPAEWGVTRTSLHWFQESSDLNNDLYYGRLGLAERGLFDSMRRVAWKWGPLPSDPAKLAFAVRAEQADVEATLPRVIGEGLFARSDDGSTICYPPQEAQATLAMKKIAKRIKDGHDARQRQLERGKDVSF